MGLDKHSRRVRRDMRRAEYRKVGDVVYLWTGGGPFAVLEVLKDKKPWSNPGYVIYNVNETRSAGALRGTRKIREAFISGPDTNRESGFQYEMGYDARKAREAEEARMTRIAMWGDRS